MTLIAQALALWARGFSVIPVPVPRAGISDGKVPAIAWREFQQRHAAEDEIRAWFATDANIGIVTGAISDVVVVDADSRDGLRWATAHLPYTPWQTKTSRGFHLFYRWPGQPVRNQARLQTADGQLAIDVRGDGGYVVGPGSLHASGARYEYAGDWTRSNVPRFWPGWLAREERRPATTRSTPIQPARPAGDVIDRARHYLGSIPRPEIGKGSDQAVLYAACKLVRGFALSDSDAVALLWEWAGGRPGWTHEWVARKVANAQQYGTEPVGALR